MSEGYVDDSFFLTTDTPSQNMMLTFNNLIKNTDIVKIMDEILTRLEKAWEQPVDIEFTASIDAKGKVRINLLQCRPLRLPRIPDSPVILPENLDAKQILFKTDRIISGGIIDSIRYVIYIDPAKYAEIKSEGMKRSVGRVVGKLNEYFRDEGEKVMAVGPGRWGSNNIDLGVNVSYADIDNITVLVEVGRAGSSGQPELSYGTHFFQDLVEADIIYLPVFPDKETTEFNNKFFNRSPNSLTKILPDYAEFKNIIRVIDVPAVSKGANIQVIADSRTRKAVCYLS